MPDEETTEIPLRTCDRCGQTDRELRAVTFAQVGDQVVAESVHVDGCLAEWVKTDGDDDISSIVAAAQGLTGQERSNAVIEAALANTEN